MDTRETLILAPCRSPRPGLRPHGQDARLLAGGCTLEPTALGLASWSIRSFPPPRVSSKHSEFCRPSPSGPNGSRHLVLPEFLSPLQVETETRPESCEAGRRLHPTLGAQARTQKDQKKMAPVWAPAPRPHGLPDADFTPAGEPSRCSGPRRASWAFGSSSVLRDWD